MGYLFFALLLFNALFMSIGSILKEFLSFILFLIFYQQKHVNIVFSYLF